MNQETKGIVLSVKTQWWLKVNTKPVRMHAMDGATFPSVIRVKYSVDGEDYCVRKWIGAGRPVPVTGSTVTVFYCSEKPRKAQVLWTDQKSL